MKYVYGSIVGACVLTSIALVGYMENIHNNVSWTHVIVAISLAIVGAKALDALAKEL